MASLFTNWRLAARGRPQSLHTVTRGQQTETQGFVPLISVRHSPAIPFLTKANDRRKRSAEESGEVEMRDKVNWHSSEPLKTREAQTNSSMPPLPKQDANRLLKEWTDAKIRGFDADPCWVEDEILGRPTPRHATDACDE